MSFARTQQRFGRMLDRLGKVPLFGVELRVEQQAAHADDGVHRRPDLMAHVRQEFRLQPSRLERRIPRL